ncbi:MAG: universal stress protein [Culicoidibacterales bacterium]
MEKKYQKIVVGIDQSEQAYRAFIRAAHVAKEYPEAELYLLSVLPLNANNLRAPQLVDDEFGDWTMEIQAKPLSRQIAELLASYEQEAYALGVKIVDYQIQVGGDPKLELLKQIREPEMTLVVVGATTKTTFQKLVLGSVSSYIVKNAQCDIYIVR